MDTFEILLEKTEQYAQALSDYKTAADKVAYDRGYFCSREREALDRAKKQLREALAEHIRHETALREV